MENHSIFRQFFTTSESVMFLVEVKQEDTFFIEVTPPFAAVVHKHFTDFSSKRLRTAFPSEEGRYLHNKILDAMAAGGRTRHTQTLYDEEYVMVWDVELIPQQHGQSAFCLGVAKERRPVESTEFPEDRWSHMMSAFEGAFWEWNVRENRLYVSPEWKRMLGIPPDKKVHTLDWNRLLHPEDRFRAQQAIAAYTAGETATYYSEHRMRCVDGSYKWMLDRGKIMERDEYGNALRIMGTQMDITLIKEKELAVQESNDQFTLLFEKDILPKLICDSWTGQVVHVNRAFLTISGCSANEMKDRPVFQEFQTTEDLFQLMRSGTTVESLPVSFKTKDGRLLHLRLHAVSQTNHHGRKLSWLTFEDRTETLKKEKELTELKSTTLFKYEQKNALLDQINHDLRTPLHVISGFSELLMDRTEVGKGQTYARSIWDASQELLKKISMIVELSKADAIMQAYEQEAFSLERYFQELFLGEEDLAHADRGDWAITIHPRVPDFIELDAYHFTKMMTAVISYLSRGPGEDPLLLEVDVNGDQQLALTFRHAESGFMQQESLELRMVSELAQRLNGSFTYHTGDDTGFTVTLPFTENGSFVASTNELLEMAVRPGVTDKWSGFIEEAQGAVNMQRIQEHITEIQLALLTDSDFIQKEWIARLIHAASTYDIRAIKELAAIIEAGRSKKEG